MTEMTKDEVTIVKKTWARVAEVGPLIGGIFHFRLSASGSTIHPKALLPDEQHDFLFLQWINALIDTLHDEKQVQAASDKLHELYVCSQTSVDCMAEMWRVVVEVIHEVLGDDFDVPTRHAWSSVQRIWSRI